MCQICGSPICSCGCPWYSGLSLERGYPVAECDECGDYIYKGDSFFKFGNLALCATCAEELDIMRQNTTERKQ